MVRGSHSKSKAVPGTVERRFIWGLIAFLGTCVGGCGRGTMEPSDRRGGPWPEVRQDQDTILTMPEHDPGRDTLQDDEGTEPGETDWFEEDVAGDSTTLVETEDLASDEFDSGDETAHLDAVSDEVSIDAEPEPDAGPVHPYYGFVIYDWDSNSFPTLAPVFELIRSVGAGFVQAEGPRTTSKAATWGLIEPVEGQYDLSSLSWIAEAKASGLDVLLTINPGHDVP